MIGKRDKIAEIMGREKAGDSVQVKGWVRTKRDAKGFSFLELNDGSCLGNIQVIADQALANYDEIKKIVTGCSVGVLGEVKD